MMNWTCEQVIKWCKSFIDDDIIIARFQGQLFYFLLDMGRKLDVFPFECSIE
jgi:hypothetical protein